MPAGPAPLPRPVGPIFLKRSSDRDVQHLEWRIRLFGAGAILGLMGMYFEVSWMVWVAIGVLALGMGLRFLPSDGQRGEENRGSTAEDPGGG